MKTKKIILSIVLIFCLILPISFLTACGDSNDNDDKSDNKTNLSKVISAMDYKSIKNVTINCYELINNTETFYYEEKIILDDESCNISYKIPSDEYESYVVIESDTVGTEYVYNETGKYDWREYSLNEENIDSNKNILLDFLFDNPAEKITELETDGEYYIIKNHSTSTRYERNNNVKLIGAQAKKSKEIVE